MAVRYGFFFEASAPNDHSPCSDTALLCGGGGNVLYLFGRASMGLYKEGCTRICGCEAPSLSMSMISLARLLVAA